MYKLFVLLLIGCALQTEAQVLTDPTLAFSLSKGSGKPILLIFAGSDWCMPCIQFNKKILSDSSFLSFSKDNLILLEADFPQRKKISKQLKIQYEALAEKYNRSGEFPKIDLLNNEGNLINELLYTQQSSAEFVNELKKKLSQ